MVFEVLGNFPVATRSKNRLTVAKKSLATGEAKVINGFAAMASPNLGGFTGQCRRNFVMSALARDGE